ncbi:MAG: DUF2155 domain-containing protein [Rhodobacterales bacterium]
MSETRPHVAGIAAGLAVAAALALPASAQSQQIQTATANGAELRVLDKINGEVEDLRLPNGGAGVVWRIQIELGECRYPVGNPTGDAYAFVTLRQNGLDEPLFSGWMIASAPALNALDHPRYDVWIIRCTTS